MKNDDKMINPSGGRGRGGGTMGLNGGFWWVFWGNFIKWIKCPEVSQDGAACPNFIVIYL